jgi:hypothetical protein
MKFNNLIKGLTIFAKYEPEGSTCAEHDTIFFMPPGAEADAITDEDKAELDQLGFGYNESDGWYCFT